MNVNRDSISETKPAGSSRAASASPGSYPRSDSPAQIGAGVAEAGGECNNAWFESVYETAAGDMKNVRWADGKPNPFMVTWLNAEAPGLIRPGSRVVVVGCGLGDDVVELINRGYDATGFDVSPTAITWARRRFPEHASNFVVADLFSLPGKFRRRFDLVVEVYTLQSLHPSMREQASAAVADMVGPRGHLLLVCRGRSDAELLESADGPPWPLCCTEVLGLAEASGLRPLRSLDQFRDDEMPPKQRIRGVFVRA